MRQASMLWRTCLGSAARLPPFIQTSLLMSMALGWFGLELILARMVHPARTIRCFQILWLFIQAQRRTTALLTPLLIGTPDRVRKLSRYARNCIVLVALQPEYALTTIRADQPWVRVAALFGACIPLYDGCLDQLTTRAARQMTRAVDDALRAISTAADGNLDLLQEIVGDQGAPADDAICWQRLITELGTWLEHQPPQRRRLVLTMMRRMNDAQNASLAERDITTSMQQRRLLSSLKGSLSFLLLRSMCLPLRSETSPCSETKRAALIEAAAVAQWIDDYADVRDDIRQGIHTYISQLDQGKKAGTTIRHGIQQVGRSLRRNYGHRAERFIDSLCLYFAVKRSHRIHASLKSALRSYSGHLCNPAQFDQH